MAKTDTAPTAEATRPPKVAESTVSGQTELPEEQHHKVTPR